jgi:hypothetical protein
MGTIQAGNLGVPGLAYPIGNRFSWPAGNDSVRLPFTMSTNGSIYFSFALQVNQIGSFTGHDTFTGMAMDAATTYFPKIDAVCNSSNAYQLGIYKGSGTSYGAIATNVFTTNDIVFVVARYNFNTNSSTDDTCDLWINPDPATFGTASAPAPTLSGMGAGAADTPGLDRITWRGATPGAAGKTVDELRIGHGWAGVTPLPPITLAIAVSGGNVVISWPTNGSAGFTLQGTAQPGTPGSWASFSPFSVQGTNYTVSVNVSNTPQFFRLVK